MKTIVPRLQVCANVAGAALLVWLAAPLLSFGERRPFDGTLARLALIAAIALVIAAAIIAARVLRRRRNAQLLDGLQAGNPAADVLAERFAHAMHLLRSGALGTRRREGRWWQPRQHVYKLPWYMFIGAPGAGKTTALLHSGLRFPLAERLGSAPIAGIGGTRQCDWWFTDQAVFIDTAGRYTTQDSHAATDAAEWQTFLQLLRRWRRAQPINGVIVTVSVPDLLHGGAELEQQAQAGDRRLQELRAQLGLSFPVYLFVTKADLLAGFVEFFGDFDATQREQPWGIAFDLPAPGAAALPEDLRTRLAALPARIAAMTPQRLQAETLLQRRPAIYHFAAQLEALLPALEGFAREAFRHAGDAPPQLVRGVHLSSGTQEGNPIDRVLGELSRSYGVTLRASARAAGSGKAYFLAGVLQRLVIPEAPLAGTNLQRQRRRRVLAAGLGGALAALLVVLCIGWWAISWRANAEYVDAVRARVLKVTAQLEPARGGDIDRLLPLYALLNQLAHQGEIDPEHASWRLDLGLFQGPRLAQSARQTYHRVLDRTLAPLLAERLAQALRQQDDPAARYEALRVGLMLATPGRLQRGEVRRWAAEAFAVQRSGQPGQAPGAGEQQEWLRHLDALLERNAVLDLVRLDDAAVRAARTALASVPFEQRVHERLMQRARERLAGDHTLAELASPAAAIVFAPADGGSAPSVAAVYTRQAWREAIEPSLEATIAELADEAAWVLGDASPALQRLARERAAREPVARQVAALHAKATIAQWDRLLAGLALQPPSERDALARFAAQLGAGESPLRQLLRRITVEFPLPAASASAAAQAYDAALAEHFGPLRDYALASGLAAVDKLVTPLPSVLGEAGGARANDLLRELRAEAGRAPQPLRIVWTGLADALGGQLKRAIEQQVGTNLAELGQACRRLTAERFPFAADAKRDMPYADFARVFGPSGLLDAFFRNRLAAQVDTSRRPWRLAGEAPLSDKAQQSLKSFEMAEDIRRLFFPAKAELPQLRLQLTPAAMDGELLMFSADVDGQLLRYENGPQRPKALLWPGPAAQQRVLLRILPAGPNGVGAEVHEGPWALLRVLQRGGWQRAGGASTTKLEVDGRALKVEVRADGAVPVALLGELGRFRCPEGW